MKMNKKLGIVVHEDFALKHIPPYPKPAFISFESPLRIKSIIEYLNKKKIFDDNRIIKIVPESIDEEILLLAHSQYHIDSIKKISKMGGGLLDDEVFVCDDTFELAKKAVSGAIQALKSVINKEVNYSFAFIRPPGHHAFREKASGLCIFNNIAASILYLRKRLNYEKKIAIIDIDNHFGDGLAQYFYDDPTILYFSVHEFDFSQADLGFLDELGNGKGLGKNINFPIPENLDNNQFLEILDFIIPILKEYNPDLIVIAAGFDMYFADPIGNGCLTTNGYHSFTKVIMNAAEEICNGKISFILEGGYSIIGLQFCVYAILSALLGEEFEAPEFEQDLLSNGVNKEQFEKIMEALQIKLSPFWNCLKQ
ncbi:MAG: histone deacetylase [Candidatus Hodarchaeota archaeon]